jgi:hypothetical protein
MGKIKMSDALEDTIPKTRITGRGNMILGGLKLSANDPHRPENTMAVTALRRARMYEAAMASLIENQPELSFPIAHLAGFAVELGLKAYLFKFHSEKEVVNMGHDLVKAWTTAHEWGLNIFDSPPEWLTILSNLHWGDKDKRMLLRYPHRTIGALGLPNMTTYRQGIAEILSAVEKQVEK